MKKVLLFILMMMLAVCATKVQAQQHVFRVKFIVTDAYCYNNGKVSYALTDLNGEVLDSLPDGLSMVRAYYQSDLADTIHYSGWYYTGGYDTLTLNNGTYTIGVEGLQDDGKGGYVRVDTHTVLVVNTTYQKPEAHSLGPADINQSQMKPGSWPSLSCINTGRVQMQIEKGRFPYKVTVLNHDTGDTLRTATFFERQYNGTFPSAYNYKDYYTIDSLGVGLWDFYLEDGCGYGLPRIEESVQVTQMPTPTHINVFAASANLQDSNVVRIQVNFDKRPVIFKELMEKYARYRFVYDGATTSEWRAINNYYDNIALIVNDTLQSIGRYCELWDRNITVEYKSTCCDTIIRQFSFQIHKPNELFFEKDSANIMDSHSVDSENPCDISIPWHRDYYRIRYHSQNYSPAYDTLWVTRYNDHEYYRYHYTHPLTWVYTDTRSGAVIKMDTVPDIVTFSYLRYEEVIAIYGNNSDTVVVPVERKLIDGLGCLLYSTFDTLSYPHCVSQFRLDWEISYEDENDHCCNKLQEVEISTENHPFVNYDSTVVRLIKSPYGGRYNFEATYHAHSQSWEVQKHSVENGAQIIGHFKGHSIVLRDYCLASGPYTFEIVSGCDTQIVSKNIAFPDIYSHRLTVRPTPTITETCSNIIVSYNGGSILNTRFNTSLETGLPLDTAYESYSMRMKVVAAPSKEMLNKEGNATTPFIFPQQGRYVIQIYPIVPATWFCGDVYYYDTLDLGIGHVEFEFAKAILCDSSSTSGHVYVRGKNGSAPYTYILYSQRDKEGDTLGINNTGDFAHVPMRSDQMLSCLIQDSCSAYFHINIPPTTLANMKKVWFDNGLKMNTSCEGDTIQVHALSIGNILQYEWSGPGGFSASTSDPYVFIPRGNGDGWYRVRILNSDCDDVISDSIFLTVQESPHITLAPDTVVCPWEPFEVRFTPSSPANADFISFSIAYSNHEGTEIRHYTAANGATVTDLYQTKSPAKIYPIGLDDGRCDYLLADPEDTLYITLRSDLSVACRLLTSYDTVCFGGDAHLTAKSTISTPYIIRWYGDYDQNRLLKSDTIIDSLSHSYYDTLGIFNRTLLFASLEEEGLCPSTNGLSTDTLLMHEGTTTLQCGRVYRFYDSGGNDPHSPFERVAHRFQSHDSTRISITFKELSLSNSSHLMIFTGNEANEDSLLYDLTGGSLNPGTVMSEGNALTLYFQSALSIAAGWEAWVESAPGIAVADVWRKNEIVLRDEVCQSQTASYDDPYGVVPEIVSAEELNLAMRQAGHYYYYKALHNQDSTSCDTIVHFEFVVNPPMQHDTVVVTIPSREGGFFWRDSLYTQSGEYSIYYSLPNGCDSVSKLYLTLLDVQIGDYEICEGDSAELAISVTTPELPSLSSAKANVGDVFCTDGSILHPDTFLASGKIAKGVVFHTDETGLHGLIVGLNEVTHTMLGLPFDDLFVNIYTELPDALFDMDGRTNSAQLVAMAESYDAQNLSTKVPAVMFCHYYDPFTRTMGTVHHGWYLPSVGEMNLLHGQSFEVNKTLRKLNNQDGQTNPISSYNYWTSTIQRSDKVWCTNFISLDFRSILTNNSNKTRPITIF